MKLRNKKTGEIVVFGEGIIDLRNIGCKNVAEMLEAGWEDYEEPKGYYYVTTSGLIKYDDTPFCAIHKDRKEIGNYFETKEEAEKAVEKLKAIQRLKNYYLKFKLDFVKNKIDFTYRLDGTLHSSVDEERIIFEDMNLLFGGEE